MKKNLIAIICLTLLPACWSKTTEEKSMSVKKMDSGLQYKITQEGTGPKPTTGQKVTVHYTGYLEKQDIQGEPDTTRKFDSSVDRGQPFQFKINVGQVIKGWDEGVMDMKVGEKRQLIIPSDLAYGAREIPGAIPANSTLIFDVELIGVE